MAASGPRHTILHWTLGDPPIPPSTQNNSNNQQNSNSSLSHSPTPPPVLWQWEVWIAEHKPQPLLSSVYIGHVQHPTDQQLWTDPSHPTKPFNLWMSTGNPSLWMKQINSRLTKIYKITWASGSYPSATLLAACRLPQELKLTSRNTMVRHEKYSNAWCKGFQVLLTAEKAQTENTPPTKRFRAWFLSSKKRSNWGPILQQTTK